MISINARAAGSKPVHPKMECDQLSGGQSGTGEKNLTVLVPKSIVTEDRLFCKVIR